MLETSLLIMKALYALLISHALAFMSSNTTFACVLFMRINMIFFVLEKWKSHLYILLYQKITHYLIMPFLVNQLFSLTVI